MSNISKFNNEIVNVYVLKIKNYNTILRFSFANWSITSSGVKVNSLWMCKWGNPVSRSWRMVDDRCVFSLLITLNALSGVEVVTGIVHKIRSSMCKFGKRSWSQRISALIASVGGSLCFSQIFFQIWYSPSISLWSWEKFRIHWYSWF